MDPTSSRKREDDKTGRGSGAKDDVARLLQIQQASIRRTADFWVEYGRRLQRGDLGLRSWLEFQSRYLSDTLEYVRESMELLPLKSRNAEEDGGENR